MERIYIVLNKIIETLLVLIFGLLVIDVVWQVVSRYVIGQSSSFTEEFARFSLIWLTVLGAAYINGRKEGHLSMDYLMSKLPLARQKRRNKVIQGLMALFAMIVMVIGGINLVYITLTLGQTSPALHLPLGYVYAIVPICGVIIIFFSFYHIKYTYNSEVT